MVGASTARVQVCVLRIVLTIFDYCTTIVHSAESVGPGAYHAHTEALQRVRVRGVRASNPLARHAVGDVVVIRKGLTSSVPRSLRPNACV